MKQHERYLIRSVVSADGDGLDGAIEGAKDKAYLAGFQQGVAFLQNKLDEVSGEKDDILEYLEGLEESDDE